MTTSYSDKLRLALQGDGDNPSTWGAIANNAVFELVEDAISGYLTLNVTGTSDITLTTANGSTDQARMAMIEFTGTLGANINVIVPTVTHRYFIKASQGGGFSVTVKTAAGTGVAFSNGQVGDVVCDGTNVIRATPSLGALASLNTITSAGLFDAGVVNLSAVNTSIWNGVSSKASVVVGDGLLLIDSQDSGKTKQIQVSAFFTAISSIVPQAGTSADIVGGTSGSVYITPKFFGDNHSLAANGYQLLPGGLLMQWGSVSVGPEPSFVTVSFPVAFGTVYQVIPGTQRPGSGSYDQHGYAQLYGDPTTTSFIVVNQSPSGVNSDIVCRWSAFGRV